MTDNDDLLRKVKDQMQGILAHAGNALPPKPETDSADEQIRLSEAMMQDVSAIGTVDGLPQPTRDESIEEARKILRWLRNMEFADRDVEQWLDNSTPKVVQAKKEALQRLVRILCVQLHAARLRGLNPDDPSLENAIDAVKAITLSVAEHTFNMLLTHDTKMDRFEEMIDALDERAMLRQDQPLTHLLDTLELGLERATGQEVSEVSAASRLLLVSEQVTKTAYQLHKPETLAAPGREESLDLARDILRKMSGLSFGEKTVQEMIETGRPEDKAAFAQAVGEMLEMYRNLLSEAAAGNPGIMLDAGVQAANTAAGQFAHAVKLMAAKEIPSSAAATQQISADVAQMPEHWGDLHHRTVDRLMKNAEGGLEKAVEELAEQQEQQQEEEQAQDAVESALQHSDTAKRRKKKRRGESKSRSGKGGKKQRKQHMDMTADDYVLKEGRFAVDAQTARNGADVPMAGLKPEDMEAIRRLGGSLRDIGNMAGTLSNVAAGDKIIPSPNEQSATQRVIETELQKNPRGNSGPGV